MPYKLNRTFKKAVNLFMAALFLFSFISPLPVKAVGETEIDSWTDLLAIDNTPEGLAASYIQIRTLTSSDPDYPANFTPIASSAAPFTGSYDGNGFEIQNLTITSSDKDVGLFSVIGASAILNDLRLSDLSIDTAAIKNTGGLVGISNGIITNSFTTGAITTSNVWSTGGLVGYQSAGSIAYTHSDVELTIRSNAGGLVGRGSAGASIETSYATGNVTNPLRNGYCNGGFAGDYAGTISNSYSKGNVLSGSDIAGFIACSSNGGSVTNSYSTGSADGTFFVGGFADEVNPISITNSFTTAIVSSTDKEAGFLSGFDTNVVITNSYWYKQIGIGPQMCYKTRDDNPECHAQTDLSYFKGNSTNEPMASWDFSSIDGDPAIWQVVPGDYPILIQPDTTPPIFTDLPGDTKVINLTEGQTVTTNPFTITVKPSDDTAVSKVEFYVDGALICTDTIPDGDGIYSCSWDTSKYHSQILVYAYDLEGNRSVALTRTTTVDPKLYLTVLPRTGARK